MTSPEPGVRRSGRRAAAKSYVEVEEEDDYTADASTDAASPRRAAAGSRKRRPASSAVPEEEEEEEDGGSWQPGEDKENLDVNYNIASHKRQRQAPQRKARAGGRGAEGEPDAAEAAELQDEAVLDAVQDGEGNTVSPLSLEELLDDSDIPLEQQRSADAEEREADGGVVTEVYLENFMSHEVTAGTAAAEQSAAASVLCRLCAAHLLPVIVCCSLCLSELHLPPQPSRHFHPRTQRQSEQQQQHEGSSSLSHRPVTHAPVPAMRCA